MKNGFVIFSIILLVYSIPGYAQKLDGLVQNTNSQDQEKTERHGIQYQVNIQIISEQLNSRLNTPAQKPQLLEVKKQPSDNTGQTQDTKALETLLLNVSESHRLITKAPASQLILRRRAQADIKLLNQALRSRGYYAAKIDYHIDTSQSISQLNFIVKLAKRYQINKVEMSTTEQFSNSIKFPSVEQLQLVSGSAADARNIILAQDKLILSIKQQAYAYAQIIDKKFIVDHEKNSMDISFVIQPGPKVFLQQAEFTGVESIDLPFLESLLPWKNDTPYHPELLEKAAQNFIDTELFSTVKVELPGENDPSRQKALSKQLQKGEFKTNTQVTLKERKHRTIKSRIAFETDTGIALSAGWTHRNLFGAGEKLTVEGAWSGVGPLLETRYRKPYFFRSGQVFVAELGLKNEDTDAYKSSSFNISAGVERNLNTGMDITLGLGFRYSDITNKSLSDGNERNTSENFSLVYMPIKFRWDTSNDLFDPDKGGKLLIQGAPFFDIHSDLRFGKLLGRFINYYKVMEYPRLVLASRLAIGGIMGANAFEIPADERFYAGGGGSIRGYGFQLASPLDKNGDPLGGNTLLEFAVETRLGFGNNMGGVIFLDGGAAYEKTLFDQSNDMRYGAGLGFRYSSPIGPLRADIAVPIDPRDDIDDPFQLYLSIGHAF